MIRFPRLTAIAALAALVLAGAAAAIPLPSLPHLGRAAPTAPPPAPALPRGQWPQAASDLPADPNVRFGSLPNGTRYAIMHNATPPGQASLRLRIDAGSLMETDAQQGLAHFLEHMAFNGSTGVPDRGEMVKILQRHGLAFGADTNASTGFQATTYKLDLPATDTDTVDSSLMLLREAAGNLLLRQEDIDKERGVVLSEERLRDTPSYRITKGRYGFLMAGQLPPRRFPIGLVPVIQNAQRAQLLDFYQKYYRPERATLVAIGDFDVDAMEAKIKARFGDWKGVGASGADPDVGRVESRGAQFRTQVEQGAPTSLQLSWVGPPDLSADTLAKRRRQWVEQLALAVLNRRLATLARGENPPFIAAGAFRGDQLRTEKITGVLLNAQPDHWQQALAAVDAEVRRAVQYGVRPDELAREIAEQDANARQAADSAATRRTPDVADEIAGTLDDLLVETHPTEDLEVFRSATKDLTAEQVSEALKTMFAGHGPLVFLSSPTAIADGDNALRDAFKSAEAVRVGPPEAPRVIDWPYADFGTPGKVAEQKEITDLDTVFVRFENGVRLTVKQTKFRDDQVLVRVRVGDGLQSLAPDRQSMAWASGALAEGGLRQISADDAERALAGQVYGMTLTFDDDAFVLAGGTRGSDLPTQLQVLAGYATDAGWRTEAFERMKRYGLTLQTQYQATDSGVLSRDLAGLMHGGDRRWTYPNAETMQAEGLDDLKAQLTPALSSGAVEVTIVGDITVDKAIAAVAATFGALPHRPDPSPAVASAQDPGFPAAASPTTITHTGRADQAIGYVAWPTNGFYADPQQARINTILTDVLQLRLIDRLRLGEGVTYSPAARSSSSFVWPRWGYISAQVEAPPARLDGFFSAVTAIAADLRTHDVGADELERAKKPQIESVEKLMATNEYWLGALSGAQRDPRRLDAIRTAEAQLERVTAADVRKAAETYLRDDTAWRLTVKPQGG